MCVQVCVYVCMCVICIEGVVYVWECVVCVVRVFE